MYPLIVLIGVGVAAVGACLDDPRKKEVDKPLEPVQPPPPDAPIVPSP